jgi:Flp pilus assembly protein TadD
MRARYRYGLAAAVAVLATAAWLAASAAEPAQKKVREPQTQTEDAAAAALSESIKAERALAKKPADRTARLRAARAQLAEGADVPSRVEAANEHALAVLNESPNDAEALLLAGQTSLLKNDARSAARYYRAATLVDAQNATAFLGLGDALTRIGDEAGANDAFRRYRALMGMPPIERNNKN